MLLQAEDSARPSHTARWLALRDVAAHHHVRLGNDRDVDRLARRVGGRAVGVVLGGGGARGFAHIGMFRALAEEGVDVDVVGGTSIGALIAGAHALGLTAGEMVEIARVFASRRKLLDHTLPLVSLMAARKVTVFFPHMFGDVRVEDLWMPLFAVSSSLSRARTVIHELGPVWHSVRASTGSRRSSRRLLHHDGDVLVDGNVMNNMPLDVMRERCEGGTVIGLNPMPTDDKVKRYHFGPSLSGWDALMEDALIERFRVQPGDLYKTIENAKWLLHAIHELSNLFGNKETLPLSDELIERVAKGIKKELLPIVKLEGIGRVRGRILFNSGFRTIEDIKRASLDDLTTLPLIGPRVAKRIKEQLGGFVRREEWEKLERGEDWNQKALSDY